MWEEGPQPRTGLVSPIDGLCVLASGVLIWVMGWGHRAVLPDLGCRSGIRDLGFFVWGHDSGVIIWGWFQMVFCSSLMNYAVLPFPIGNRLGFSLLLSSLYLSLSAL